MPRMRSVDAAVAILEREGVDTAFGVPGAAINPFYSAMRAHGGIRHILARHVEGASHMAEGYTRAAAGNIGLCVGNGWVAGASAIEDLDRLPTPRLDAAAIEHLHYETTRPLDAAASAESDRILRDLQAVMFAYDVGILKRADRLRKMTCHD